jgi:lipopolysaccharide transport system ATP-binding protein
VNAISVHNVSKLYRLGEISREQLLADAHRWWMQWKARKAVRGNRQPIRQSGEEGDFWALRDVSFDVNQGETLGIIGANGAGKSTLLKIISKITAPTTGRVRITGRVGSLLEVGTGFHPDLTGRDNVFLNGAILGMNRAEVKSKFDEIVAFSGLEQFIDTPVKRYSSGMYVRLAFSVAAFLEPEILILDEVLSVGDMAFSMKCNQRMEKLAKGHHTIVFVAHDIGSVTKFCDHALWLEKGTIRDYGTAEVVAENYRNSQLQAYNGTAKADSPPDERSGTGEFLVTNVSLLDQNGSPTQSASCGSPCIIRLDCERKREDRLNITSTTARVVIYDEVGGRMFALSSVYGAKQLPEIRGRTSVLCEIPKLPLLPGKYSINYSLDINGECADTRASAATFEVVSGDFYGTNLLPPRASTPLCVDCSWKAERSLIDRSPAIVLQDD